MDFCYAQEKYLFAFFTLEATCNLISINMSTEWVNQVAVPMKYPEFMHNHFLWVAGGSVTVTVERKCHGEGMKENKKALYFKESFITP